MNDQPVIIDVYHPLVSDDHDDACASLCTNDNDTNFNDGCDMTHHCWCPDGSLSFDAFQAKHPDVTVAER